MNSTFHEQLGGVAEIFEQWGPCERTVVACALARRVPWPGLKLVQRAVEAALQLHVEDERLERDANDETLLANLLTVRSDDDDDECEERLRRLVCLLPLLRADCVRGKAAYVAATPALVRRCVDCPRSAAHASLCRQLLSYLLVHPALNAEEQNTVTQWLRYLENHISGNRNTESVWQQRIVPCLLPENNIWGSNNVFRRTIGKNVEFRSVVDHVDGTYNAELQESFSKNGRDVDIEEQLKLETMTFPKSQRSNSLTPPSTQMQMSSSAENLSEEPFVQKQRSFSLSSEHGLVRGLGLRASGAGSETRLDELRGAAYPGMSTVAQWLKSLRLHKYIWLFTNITYDQMMAIDDDYLDKLGVTKGARHKILVSIKKLEERVVSVRLAQAELHAAPGRALQRLRAALLGPMPPALPAPALPPLDDLPAELVRTLDIASKVITGSTGVARPDDEEAVDPMALHCWLVEKALHHEAFVRPSLQEALRRLRHRLPPRQFFTLLNDMPPNRRTLKPRWRSNVPPCVSGGPGLRGVRRWAPRVPGPAPAPAPRPKSHSYPPYPAAPVPAPPDEYSSLDALCLQMTEQAIN